MAVAEKQKVSGDPRVEDWLKSHRAKFEFDPDFPLDAIDREASERNQARIAGRPIIEEFVSSFGAAMGNGDSFPPIVVYRAKKRAAQPYVIIDGNHRATAAENNKMATFPTYVVVDPAPKLVRLLTYDANVRHGIPTTPEERVQHGVYLVEEGMTAQLAARTLGIPRHTIDAELKRRAARTALSQYLSDQEIEKLPLTALDRLASVRSDEVAASAARLIGDAKLPAERVSALIRDINAERSEAGAMKIVDDHRQIYEPEIRATAGGKFGLSSAGRRLNSALGMVLTLNADRFMTESIDEEYASILIGRIALAQDHLAELDETLKLKTR